MDDIFIFHISPFLDDSIYMNSISLLCKCKVFENRRVLINRKKCGELLQKRFKTYINTDINTIQEAIDEPIDIVEIFKDLQEELFDEDLLERSHMNSLNHHKIFYNKYCYSRTIIYYYNANTISDIDFETNQEIVHNVGVCSTYRLNYIQKRLLVKHYPYAKALIY
jgi:hypothetical protein